MSATLGLPPGVKPRHEVSNGRPEKAPSRVQGRAEVTVKFNEVPPVREDKDGIALELDCGEGWIITARLRPKSWRKALAAMEEYPQWVAAITGKLGRRTPHGLMLADAGIQVFEKKPKGQAEEGTP